MKKLSQFSFIDVHYHANPDLYERRHSALEAGRIYQKHQGAVVLKSHLGSTAVQATLAQAEGLPVLPSVTLNDIAGGIDYRVVLNSLSNYKPHIESRMIVHLPTLTGRTHNSKLSRQLINPQHADFTLKSLTISDEKGRIKNEVLDLFRLSSDEPIVISTGHASKAEVYALIDLAGQYPQSRLMLNQPANPLTGLSATELLALSGALPHLYIEQTFLTYALGYQSWEDFSSVLMHHPSALYSSDLGQPSQIDLVEHFDLSLRYFEQLKLPLDRITRICQTNAQKMLNL
jgi:hypothetical protein